MDDRDTARMDRRRFVLGAIPACAGTCMFLKASLHAAHPQAPAGQAAPPAAPHKFDTELPRKMTYREAFAFTYTRSFIPLALFMTKKLGREASVDLLKASAAEQAVVQAADAAKFLGGRDFAAFKKAMHNPAVQNLWTPETVEDGDTVHELRVKECLWAETFRAANAADEGYAAVCYADYAFANAFNPQIELHRDKTLMQGHPFCNHRYAVKK